LITKDCDRQRCAAVLRPARVDDLVGKLFCLGAWVAVLVGVVAGLAFSVAAGLCTSVDGVGEADGDADGFAYSPARGALLARLTPNMIAKARTKPASVTSGLRCVIPTPAFDGKTLGNDRVPYRSS
jgi:hypothetical protein